MFDPFQIKKAAAGPRMTEKSEFRLRDTGQERTASRAELLRSRKRMVRAIELLDLLTSGDEKLHEYLTQQAERAQLQPGQGAAAAESGDTDRGLPPMEETLSPLDEQLKAPPPPLNSIDFEQLKRDLLAQCRKEIEQGWSFVNANMILASCGVPGCLVHSIDKSGDILHHYTDFECNSRDQSPAFLAACAEFERDMEKHLLNYAEVYKDKIILVDRLGEAREIPLS